jgi:hypothetical protein
MATPNSNLPTREVDPGGADSERPPLSEAARRALAEAEERRARVLAGRPREYNGRGGHDPARYGDWEVKGIASDF